MQTPPPFGVWGTLSSREKGSDEFLQTERMHADAQSLPSSPSPVRFQHNVHGTQQAPGPLHGLCPLPGIPNPNLPSPITRQAPPDSADSVQLSPLLESLSGFHYSERCRELLSQTLRNGSGSTPRARRQGPAPPARQGTQTTCPVGPCLLCRGPWELMTR